MKSHLGLLHVRIHTLLDLQLDGLDLRGLGELRADDAVPESGDGVSCLSHLLHFVPGILLSDIIYQREHTRLLKIVEKPTLIVVCLTWYGSWFQGQTWNVHGNGK